MVLRYHRLNVLEDLKTKMALIGGPRQVGKTYFVNQIGEYFKSEYFNWDFIPDKDKILNRKFSEDSNLLIFDEIHKYKNWKNYIKGEFDVNKTKHSILVTGSARLDLYKKGGDSLLGRYHYYRLHPLSLFEIISQSANVKPKNLEPFKRLIMPDGSYYKEFETLYKFGGFPEAYLKADETYLRRWHNDRIIKIVKEDIRDIEYIKDVSTLEIFVSLLPDRVGSMFSINSVREDLSVSHQTISSWLEIMDNFYYIFRCKSFQTNKVKAIKKENKIYLWDWSELKDDGKKMENIVASHLLKFCHYIQDVYGYKMELCYLRDLDKHEVDFAVTCNSKIWFTVEVKNSEDKISKHLLYFKDRLGIKENYQVVNERNVDYTTNDVRVISVERFLMALV